MLTHTPIRQPIIAKAVAASLCLLVKPYFKITAVIIKSPEDLTRALRLLSDCNMSLTYSGDEQSLLVNICRTIVETGGYLMSWIGYVEHNGEKSIRCVAKVGNVDGYLDNVRLSWNGDTEDGCGPAGTAVRTMSTQVVQDIRTNPLMTKWRDSALIRGYLSCASIPLVSNNHPLGVLNLYQSRSPGFSLDEVKLLEEMARNLVFGIEKQRDHLSLVRLGLSLRKLIVQSEAMREEERKIIAREVHDELGQLLTALRMNVGLLDIRYGEQDADLHNSIAGIIKLLDQTIGCARDVVNNLRPVVLDMGVVPALQWLRDEFVKNTGTPCNLYFPKEQIQVDEGISISAFRVVQESLTNVARYANASKVEISIAQDADNFSVTICDDGIGFESERILEQKSFGLLGMRERALSLEGEVYIYSFPGEGTQIYFVVPNKKTSLKTESHP